MATTKVQSELIADDVALAGNPTTSTQSAGNNTTRIATTAFVTTAINNLIDSAPGTLDTLDEIAAALNDDPSFTTTVNNAIATKLPLAGGTMTGNIAHASDFTIDVGGDISLDAAGDQIRFKDAGTEIGHINMDSQNLTIRSTVSDKDIIFTGNDDGVSVTALTLDMSNAGNAIFNSGGEFHGSLHLDSDSAQLQLGDDNDMQVYHNGAHGTINVATGNLGLDAAGDITLDAGGGDWVLNDDGTEIGRFTNSSSDFVIKAAISNQDLIFKGNDGGSIVNALILDMSDGGSAYFNHDIYMPSTGTSGSPINNYIACNNDANGGGSLLLQAGQGSSGYGGGLRMYGHSHASKAGWVSANISQGSSGKFAVNDQGLGGGTDLFVVQSDGKVGIGTTSPSDELHVKGGAGSSFIRVDNSADGHDTGFNIYQNGSRKWEIHSDDSNSDALDFRPAGIQKFTMTQDGNFGIGTTSPGHPLHIVESADGPKIRLTRGGTCEWDFSISDTSTLTGVGSGALELLPQNANTANEFAIGKAGTTTPLFHIKNDQSYFTYKLGLGTTSPQSFLHVAGAQNDTYGQVYVYGSDSNNDPQIAMGSSTNGRGFYIDDSDTNRFKIYTGHGKGASSGAYEFVLDNSGTIESLRTYNNTTGSYSANVYVHTDGSFNRATSSRRYKKDIVDAEKGLEEILKLKPRNYKPKNDRTDKAGLNEEVNDPHLDAEDRTFAGLIAEEVHDLGLTEYVDYEEDGKTPSGLYYGNMVALLVKGIQELKAENDALSARIKTLEDK